MYHTDKKTDPALSEILKVAFPNCKLKQYTVEVSNTVPISGTYWSGGSRNSYVAVNLENMETLNLPHLNPPQFGGPTENPIVNLLEQTCQVCVVKLSNVGMREYVTFYFAPDNVNKFLTDKSGDSLSNNEKIVLFATRNLKSSYAGIKNYRFNEANTYTGITLKQWNESVDSLIDKGLLRKNKSITPAGKNAVNSINHFYELTNV